MLLPLGSTLMHGARAGPSSLLKNAFRLPRSIRSRLNFERRTPTQIRYAGTESTRIDEDEELDHTRRSKDEGAIMAVQSGLFKLLLPLPRVSASSLARRLTPVKDESAVMFLLHPRQPLAMIATLIESELSAAKDDRSPLAVTFHGANESELLARERKEPQTHQWAQATELGDFVQEAAKDSKFVIAIQEKGQPPCIIAVRVPTFKQRTRFLRYRLVEVTKEMQSLLDIKTECDGLALRGARRTATAGFGGLIVYWGIVYYLTFHKYGWDIMEPVTYLTGLTGIMGGYLFFLYNQREISYRSVFEMSSSKRREQLYDLKGFDRLKWQDLVDEGTELRRAIKKIAHDYNEKWSMDKELDYGKAVNEIKKNEKQKLPKENKDGDGVDNDASGP